MKSKEKIALEILKEAAENHGYSIANVLANGDVMNELCSIVNDESIIQKVNAFGYSEGIKTRKDIYCINNCFLEWFSFIDSWDGRCWMKQPGFVNPKEIKIIEWETFTPKEEVEDFMTELSYQ